MFDPMDAKKRFLAEAMKKASGGMHEDLKSRYGKPVAAVEKTTIEVPGPAQLKGAGHSEPDAETPGPGEPDVEDAAAHKSWGGPTNGSLEGVPPELLAALVAMLGAKHGGGKV